MELELRYRKGEIRLFLDGKKTRYSEGTPGYWDPETKAKHWIATEIEKLIGLSKSVKITVEELVTPGPPVSKDLTGREKKE